MGYSLFSFFLPFTGYPYEGTDVPCPACGSDDVKPLVSLDRRLKRLPSACCQHCGLIYTNPMPTDAELADYYANFYRFDYQAVSSEPTERHLAKRRKEAAFRAEQVRDLLSTGMRTLDFGCGTGEFVSAMADLGHQAHGFEPGETYGNFARRKHGDRIKVSGWQQADFPAGGFGLVSCFHVVEHLAQPVEAMKKMAEWASPDGYVYVEVPDLGQSQRNKGFGYLHFAHLINFNTHNLVVAAARAGLVPVKRVAPTGIIFQRGDMPEAMIAEEAGRGAALAQSLYGEGRMISNYLRYQAGKVTGASRRP